MVSDARARRAVRGGVRVGGWGSSGEGGLEHWGAVRKRCREGGQCGGIMPPAPSWRSGG